jgi:formylglycine-generating enzyme required for sulfatase activity
MKESRNALHTECDETRCMQNIAGAFQSELIATANVTKQGGTYFLALSIQNIFDNKVVYSESLPCEGCNPAQVVEKLKELSGNIGNSEANEAALAKARKAKAEELKQEQLSFEEKLRNADATERKHLLEAKAEDDKHLANLKAQAEARRKKNASSNQADFPTVESAISEINRLKESIGAIEKSYENELTTTRLQVNKRYATQISAIEKSPKDEFETNSEHKLKVDKKRADLLRQQEEELARLNIKSISESETTILRDRIKALSERVYVLGVEALMADVGIYDPETQYFPIKISSKTSLVPISINAKIFVKRVDAKTFKQQWAAGLIRPEVKVQPDSLEYHPSFINDADNTHFVYFQGIFLTEAAKQDLIDNSFISMINISGGSFEMGADDGRDTEKPAHHVTISKSFAMSQTEVTKSQFETFVNETGYSTGNKCWTLYGQIELRIDMNWMNLGYTQDKNEPVTCISWIDAKAFTEWLSNKTGKKYRLPTEAEWEYACQGGEHNKFCGSNDASSVAVFGIPPNGLSKTNIVASKKANAFGLFDMSGNVFEYVEDDFHANYNLAPVDGSAWSDGSNYRVTRGGYWNNLADYVKSSSRTYISPNLRANGGGFRVARTLQ